MSVSTILKSSTHLFNIESSEQEDYIHAVVWIDEGNIVTENGPKRIVFFNLESDEDFDKKGIVFKPESHRIGRNGRKEYITVDKVIAEFDHELIQEHPTQDNEIGEDKDDKSNESLTDPFETEEVDQNVGETRIISTTSTDKDLLSDLDVNRF